MIIGFTGKMGVGKSTAISEIDLVASCPVKLVKFAQPLYDIQEFAYERISSVLARPEDFKKDRKLLQWLGTEWGRGLREDLWVQIWTTRALYLSSKNVVVCDDVRFDNEAETIKALGGVVVHILGPSRGADIGIASHKSEAGISPSLVDYVLTNEGDEDDFKDRVSDLYGDLCRKNLK